MNNLINKFKAPIYQEMSFRKRVRARYNMLTNEKRALPNFMIIGAQKAGTTSLFRYLSQHSNISGSPFSKELNFFDEEYNRGVEWYRSNFPVKKEGNHYFEGTTHYLFNPAVPSRVKEMLPNAKFIILLRNPIDRAFSSYKHQIRAGRETLPFEEAIQSETARLAGEEEKLLNDPTYISYNYTHYSYIERGKYSTQINRWLKTFNKEQLLIIPSNDLFSNTESTLNDIFNFLSIPAQKININKKHNTGNYTDKMSPAIREHLSDIFLPYNEELYQIIDRDLQWN